MPNPAHLCLDPLALFQCSYALRCFLQALYGVQKKDNALLDLQLLRIEALGIGSFRRTLQDVVPWNAGKIDLGNPRNLGSQIGQKFLGIVRAALGDVTPDASQVRDRKGGDDQAFRRNGLRVFSDWGR